MFRFTLRISIVQKQSTSIGQIYKIPKINYAHWPQVSQYEFHCRIYKVKTIVEINLIFPTLQII